MLLFGLAASATLALALALTTEEHSLPSAYLPGDIVIGGLFPIHLQSNRTGVPGPLSCSHYSYRLFLQAQAMIYAIGEVNRRRLLPGVTLGYHIRDTCGDVGLALGATLDLLRGRSGPRGCGPEAPEGPAKLAAVIGERFSEVSIAVARILALDSVPQISYASTSELLSRKFKFPTFLRTISSDEYQTKAIAQLVQLFNWKSVAIVGSDDEYGKYGSERLSAHFRESKDVCLEWLQILPGHFEQNGSESRRPLRELLDAVNSSSAEAVVLFTKETNVELIVEAAVRHGLNRTWIASDSWSASVTLATTPGIRRAGRVFGFDSKRKTVPGFQDHILSGFVGAAAADGILDYHRTHYPLCSHGADANCTLSDGVEAGGGCVDIRCLASHVGESETYNVHLAVRAIAEGVRRLLGCGPHRCERKANFSASELLAEIKKINLTVDTTHLFFDTNGDPSLGYDILYWDTAGEKRDQVIQIIGEYWPNGQIAVPRDLVKRMRSVQVTAYNCSKSCKAGQELKRQKAHMQCCADCVPCAEGEYSAGGQGAECRRCREHEYSAPERERCLEKKLDFLGWSDPLAVILGVSGASGVLATAVTAALFAVHRATPVVKAVGGSPLCFVELSSLLTCFGLTFSFPGQPGVVSCVAGTPLFGTAFSLCASCILANLLQILGGFAPASEGGAGGARLARLARAGRPAAVVALLSGIQLALCACWLALAPPAPARKNLARSVLLECHKGPDGFFVATLAYNALLALLSFLFAFQGRRLPDLYKNASLVAVGMLLYLIVWALFIPIYVNLFGAYKPAIESAAILISSYGALCCHLAPKCYIMLFRKELNDQRAILEHVRKHYEAKGISVVK
ncbi:G-protein coupled receptor family C group 6 member A-like [Stigmatopora argus]